MINNDSLKISYPIEVHDKRVDILREYLQYLMLEIIYTHPIGRRLTFLGGTCLRLVHDSQRFSEDLNFDNDGLTEKEFEIISEIMLKELPLRGYEVEAQIKGKTAFRCSIKFLNLLQKQGLSGFSEEKLVIQIDTQAQKFGFKSENFLLNQFGVFVNINTTPIDIIFSQKCHAILDRPRNKGRDFYDVVFLLGRNIKPNYAYLEQKVNITNPEQLRERILTHWEKLDQNQQLDDVKSYLFNEKDQKMITLFGEVIKQAKL